MVFLNFLPEVIPGHYNFGMNRQEILREIYLWYSKRAVFSRFGDIWLLSKIPLRRRVCNTKLALKKSTSRAFFLPLRDAKYLLRNFLVRQFEWDLLYPSKIRLPWFDLTDLRYENGVLSLIYFYEISVWSLTSITSTSMVKTMNHLLEDHGNWARYLFYVFACAGLCFYKVSVCESGYARAQ